MKLMPHALQAAMLPALAALALTGCVAPMGPIEVTRFLDPGAYAQFGNGPIAVVPGEGMEGNRLEADSYAAAVRRELARLGYQLVDRPGSDTPRAIVFFERVPFQPGRGRGPVSVGVGGSTGSYGSGVGVGVGIDLSGPPPKQVTTHMNVRIQDRAGATIWESRASFTVRADAPLAQSQLGAAKMAQAMFKDFPGNNGESFEVR